MNDSHISNGDLVILTEVELAISYCDKKSVKFQIGEVFIVIQAQEECESAVEGFSMVFSFSESRCFAIYSSVLRKIQ
jgi:hypothetical protein